MCEEGPGVSRTCDGLLAVNVMSAAAARTCFQAGVRGSHCAGLGAGAAHGPSGWSGRVPAVIFFDRQAVFLRAAKASFSAARNQNPWGLPRGVYWVVRGLCVHALCLRGCFAKLRWGRPKVDAAMPKREHPSPRGTRKPTRMSTRSEILVLLGAQEPPKAGRGPAGAAGPGLVPHSR